jgi:hypothetical protein
MQFLSARGGTERKRGRVLELRRKTPIKGTFQTDQQSQYGATPLQTKVKDLRRNGYCLI